jgi:hypothetical protein
MSILSDRFEYSVAKPEDSNEILKVFESIDFKGGISVLYTRRPDPYKSFMHDSDKFFMPVVREKGSGKICAVGCCVIRKAFINGEIKNTGYLTGLKILPEFKKKLIKISEVYKQIFEETQDCVDIYYTTILKENVQVQKMLEKKRKNMPEYRLLGAYTVYCFRTGKKKNSTIYTLHKGFVENLNTFINKNLECFNFSPINIDFPGIFENNVYTLKDDLGEIVAACAIWNQQSYKQNIVTGYSGVYRLISKLPLKWLGYPDFPTENSTVNYGCVTCFCVKDNDLKLAEIFLGKVAENASEFSFLMFGLLETHPLADIFKKIKHIKYQSKAYTVHKNWGENRNFDNRPINIEVGLL